MANYEKYFDKILKDWKLNRIKLLKILINNNDFEHIAALNKIFGLNVKSIIYYYARYNKIDELLKLNIESSNIMLSTALKGFARYNNMDSILKYNKFINIELANIIAVNAASRSNFKILDYALKKGAYNVKDISYMLIFSGNYDKINEIYNIEKLEIDLIVSYSVAGGYYDYAKKYSKYIKDYTLIASYAAKYGRLDFLETLIENSIDFDINKVAESALMRNKNEIFIWCVEHNACNFFKFITIAMKKGNTYIINWILDNKMFKNVNFIAENTDDILIVELALKHGANNFDNIIKNSKRCSNSNIIELIKNCKEFNSYYTDVTFLYPLLFIAEKYANNITLTYFFVFLNIIYIISYYKNKNTNARIELISLLKASFYMIILKNIISYLILGKLLAIEIYYTTFYRAIINEVFFRAFLTPNFKIILFKLSENPKFSIMTSKILTSLIFAYFIGNNFILYFMFSLGCENLFQISGNSLLACIIFDVIWNSLSKTFKNNLFQII